MLQLLQLLVLHQHVLSGLFGCLLDVFHKQSGHVLSDWWPLGVHWGNYGRC